MKRTQHSTDTTRLLLILALAIALSVAASAVWGGAAPMTSTLDSPATPSATPTPWKLYFPVIWVSR